jgi:hypothetical protein
MKAKRSKRSSQLPFITVFPDFQTFTRFAKMIAWETEVWIEERPDHLVHFNGGQFLAD